MAVAWFRNPDLDQSAPVIDRGSVNERTFGRTTTRRHPAYVYSINKNACLMHKIASVEIHWYAFFNGGKLGRLKQPAMIATTMCGMSKPLTSDLTRTCHVPFPDSELCGRCHGHGTTFPKVAKGRSKITGRTRQEANVTLGCIVNGYPSSLDRFTNQEDRSHERPRDDAPRTDQGHHGPGISTADRSTTRPRRTRRGRRRHARGLDERKAI